MSEAVYVASTSEEHFSSEDYKSREDAIKYAPEELDLYSGDGFYIGKAKQYIIPMPDAKTFFYSICEQDDESLGDWSEYWEETFNKKTELHEKINKKFEEIQELIMKEHKPMFFTVNDIEEVICE